MRSIMSALVSLAVAVATAVPVGLVTAWIGVNWAMDCGAPDGHCILVPWVEGVNR